MEYNKSAECVNIDCDKVDDSKTLVSFMWYLTLSCVCLVVIIVLMVVGRLLQMGQKTRNSQQRRTYVGSRQRPSVSQTEPTIYVSPANLPPPPKYEAMAPPSYEEVVGIHYPNYQPPVQPITQPLSTALAQSSSSSATNVANDASSNNTRSNEDRGPATVVTVTNERTAVTASS